MHRLTPPLLLVIPLALSAVVACPPSDDDDSTSSSSSGGSQDAGMKDAGGGEDAGLTQRYGFTFRVPQERVVPCTGMYCNHDGGTAARDVDYLCTLSFNGRHEYVYVQATPTQFREFFGYVYEVASAWHSDGTTAGSVPAVYNYGGNHNNDTVTITLDDYQFRYNHSTFGFGFRACQPPDCLEVYHAADGGEVQNGCLDDRALPEICVQVLTDGVVPELVDTFHWCRGVSDHDAGL